MKTKEVGDKYENYQKKLWELEDKELQSLLMLLLIFLMKARKGGETTLKILDELLARPCNANQLSNKLNVDYNTIRFHLKILLEHKYVERISFGNTYIIHPSDKLIKRYDEYLIIKEIFENE